MNIIFGTEMAEQAQEKYTVLELDTFNLVPTHEVVTAYCLVETVPITEMPAIESLNELHRNLMAEYRKQNWRYCEDAIAHLTGKWHGELDSFYTELYQRIQGLKQEDLSEDWTGRVDKTVEVV
jgi:hypothetical protein